MADILPSGSVGVWPDTPGFKVYEYGRIPPARAWRQGIDELGRKYQYKLTATRQDVAISYKPALPGPGRYVIEVYIPGSKAEARNAGYHVVYYDGSVRREKVTKVNQQANPGRWVSLGTYDLDPRMPNSGRVNATDYSPENTANIAFGGVRWVPENVYIALRREKLKTDGGASNERKAPTGPTNQDAINAFIVGSAEFGEKFTDWISAVGLDGIYRNRKAVYGGTAITDLRGLSADRLALVSKALTLPAKQLASAAVEASKRKPGKVVKGDGKADGRTWGVHGSAGFGVPPRHLWDYWINEFVGMGLKWYKQCDNGGDDRDDRSCFRWVLALRDAGITPVIRYQVSEQYPNGMADNYFHKMGDYAKEGVIWAEIGNEPNLPWEWSGHKRDSLSFNNPETIQTINQQWVEGAERALKMGVRPAYPAFAPTDWRGGMHPTLSSVGFYERSFAFLGQSQWKDRVRRIFADGGWLAVHVSVYEQAPDFDPYAQNPVWDMCLRGYEVPMRAIEKHIGINADDLVIMSTEGGVFTPESTSMNNRPRLANNTEHAQKTVEMFDYIETKSPLTAMMPWCIAVSDRIGHAPGEYKHDGWYVDDNPREVVATLKRVHAQRNKARAGK